MTVYVKHYCASNEQMR